jgi:hypothetical protein
MHIFNQSLDEGARLHLRLVEGAVLTSNVIPD